jgi:hypothetical protein
MGNISLCKLYGIQHKKDLEAIFVLRHSYMLAQFNGNYNGVNSQSKFHSWNTGGR